MRRFCLADPVWQSKAGLRAPADGKGLLQFWPVVALAGLYLGVLGCQHPSDAREVPERLALGLKPKPRASLPVRADPVICDET